MAEVLKGLGQLADPISITALYTVPAATSAVVSTIFIANRTAASKTFRVEVWYSGASADNKQVLYADVTISKNDTFAITAGITLATGDSVRVSGSAAGLSFNAFGTELT